jgi:CopG family nickel-responsive transcriptional regulator
MIEAKRSNSPWPLQGGENMADLIRYGISIDRSLSRRFDRLLKLQGYANRSEAIRDLIRDSLVEEEWESGSDEAIGVVTLLYDHQRRELSRKLVHSQHVHHAQTLSSLHIHLDGSNCLEVIVLRALPTAIKKLAQLLIGTKGVKHGKLVMTSTGRGLD